MDWAMEAVGLAAAVTARVGAGWEEEERAAAAAVVAPATGGWGLEAAGCRRGKGVTRSVQQVWSIL